jgi:peptidoglycan/LPS O-acetylase OafA/YrhL
MTTYSYGYRADVDGLRAVAVISVLLFHAFPQFVTGGFVGVDIFFVISGFLISSILIREIEEGRFSILYSPSTPDLSGFARGVVLYAYRRLVDFFSQ